MRSVATEIRRALRDTVVREPEAQKIVQAAERGGVKPGELKAIKDLYGTVPSSYLPLDTPAQANESSPFPWPVMTGRSAQVLASFLSLHGVSAAELRALEDAAVNHSVANA